MESLKELKKLGDHKHTIYSIVAERYGIESPFFNPRFKNRIGLEDVEEELDANEEETGGEGKPYADPETATDVGATDDMGYGEDIEDGPTDVSGEYPDPNAGLDGIGLDADAAETTPEDEFAGLSRDGEFGNDGEGDYTVDSSEWEETSYDDLKSDADCINMVKIISNYTNQYALNFETFVKQNPEMIDYTGDFKQLEMYNQYVAPAMDIITKMFKDDPIVKHFENLIELMSEKRKVLSVCGKPDNPFMYEGMQIVLYDALRSVLACIPYSIKNNQTLSEVIESMKLNVVKCLIQMVADLVEVGPIFGTKIYYVEPVVSEITGKSEEITNTPYAKLDVMKGTESVEFRFSRMRFANESIMNLVEIKNNKALVEFSALSKMMVVITGLTKDIDIKTACLTALDKIMKVASSNAESVVQDLDTCIDYFRNEVFIPEIKAMAALAAEEDAKLTEEPETNVELNDGAAEMTGEKETVTSVEIAGAEVEPEEGEDFDNDL